MATIIARKLVAQNWPLLITVAGWFIFFLSWDHSVFGWGRFTERPTFYIIGALGSMLLCLAVETFVLRETYTQKYEAAAAATTRMLWATGITVFSSAIVIFFLFVMKW